MKAVGYFLAGVVVCFIGSTLAMFTVVHVLLKNFGSMFGMGPEDSNPYITTTAKVQNGN